MNVTAKKMMVRQNVEIATPSTRGTTRYTNGSMPMASNARTSPCTFMLASSVAIAVPLRAMTTKLVNSGPSSRSTTAVRMGPIKFDCPSRVSQYCACTTTNAPTITAISAINPVASKPVNNTCRAKTLRKGAVQVRGRIARSRTAHVMAARRVRRLHRVKTPEPMYPRKLIRPSA